MAIESPNTCSVPAIYPYAKIVIMNKKILNTYLATLGVLTIIASLGYLLLLNSGSANTLSLVYIAVFYMPTPLYALVISHKLIKTPLNIGQYGTIKNIDPRGILFTIGLFLSWIVAVFCASALLSSYLPDTIGNFATNSEEVRENLAEIVGQELAASGNMPSSIIEITLGMIIASIFAGFTINLLFALGEEYGWRGYLRKEVKSRNARIFLIGSIWGLWHAPLILTGYNYTSEYAIPGVGMMVLFTIAMSYAMEVILSRYNNILYAGALHGMFNALAGSFVLILGSYNPLVGGPVGIVSVFCFIIVTFLFSLIPNKKPVVKESSKK